MFSPVSMLRLSAVVLERDERAVLRGLAELGAVQLTRAAAGPDTAPLPPRDHSTELARCDRLLARIEELRKSLAIPATVKAPEPPRLSRNDEVAAAPQPNPLPRGGGEGESAPPQLASAPHGVCGGDEVPGHAVQVRRSGNSHPGPLLADAGRGDFPHGERANGSGRTSATATDFPLPSLARGEGQGEGSQPGISSASSELSLEQAENKLRSLESRASELLCRRQRLLQRWSEMAALSEQVSSYREVAVPLDEIGGFSFLHFVTGSLPLGNLEQLETAVGDNVALLPLQPQAGRQPLIAMTTRGGRSALENVLQRAGFQRETLPVVAGATPESLAEESRREQEQLMADLERLEGDIHSLAAEIARPLAELEQAVNAERRLLEAEQHFPRTDAAVLITGWIPADDALALEQHVKQITGGRCAIAATEPRDVPEEEVPVLLRHARLLRPFAMLVTGYGLPKYRELAPTLFLAVSYVLMFGIMFGDAGHGALLALAGLWALRAGRSATTRDAGLLLLLCGLSSTVWGVVYGSCFGITGLKRFALWHDPLEGDPMMLLYGAMGVGVVMISLGLVLNIINHLRRGDALGALLDKFGVAGALFYWGALLLVTKYAALQARGLVNLALALFIALPIVAWALKEPLEYVLHRRAGRAAEPGGLTAAVTESLVGAFEAAMSFLANTISFVRLAAYAMSHAALLMATFMMAAEVGRVSGAGGALSVLVIVAGNLVAILLEGVVASVQALRLEYYEFFGKFFSGGGQPFKPFRLTPA
ncbi:MAG: hypothetical protein FJ388_02200 [Verrucomicrobia bacterium]|nr:hypothetical protein [Verrucomicrobiota bacterium]